MDSQVGNQAKQTLETFLKGLTFRLNIVASTKAETDLLLARDFNVFTYIKPDENRLSDILADLLDPKGAHGQRELFLREFLTMIGKAKDFELFDLQKVTVKREQATDFLVQSQRRIDVTLLFSRGLPGVRQTDANFTIAIENKPWAEDQPRQLRDYAAHLKKSTDGSFLLIYLSQDGSHPSSESLSQTEREQLERDKKYMALSYWGHLRDWLRSSRQKVEAEKIRVFLTDFIQYLEHEFRLVGNI